MAKAPDTLIEWSLDDYVADLIATLGCERDAALWEMWDRIVNERLLFTRQRLVDGKPCNPADGKPYNPEVVKPSYVRSNYNFNFDDNDRVKVISREWFDYRYTVAEPPQPPEVQPAPDQQPEDKAGPDRKTGASSLPTVLRASDPPKRMSTQEWVTAEAIQLKKDNKIPANARQHISHFAKLLANRMDKAAETNKLIRPRKWEHIKNMLPKWKLWPIESI
jgi:hypothetical protein